MKLISLLRGLWSWFLCLFEEIEIKLVRHGLSQGNTGEADPREVGDYDLLLSEPVGPQQAHNAGQIIGRQFLTRALIYRSPYRRARQTHLGIMAGAGLSEHSVRFYEDPRLREVDHGYEDIEPQEYLRRVHGWFYYRFEGGESPADCFDRLCSFLDSLMRQMRRKRSNRAIIVSHGLSIRCFVMRFMHLTVEQFDSIATPNNCDIITITSLKRLKRLGLSPQFVCGKWGVVGLRFRNESR